MEMQDKELDELFRSKLDDFEAEPSAGAWAGIDDSLINGKRKRTLMLFFNIAASIIVLTVMGILFMPHKKESNDKHLIKINTAKTLTHSTARQSEKGVSKPNEIKTMQTGKLNKTGIAAANFPRVHTVKAKKQINADQLIGSNITNDSLDKTGNQAEFASLNKKHQDVIKPVVPGDDTEFAMKQTAEITMVPVSTPLLLSVQLPDITKANAEAVKLKHKIHSLGELINMVVAKVDKRQDKFIEFTGTDDESTITGVNIGIIKIKKDK